MEKEENRERKKTKKTLGNGNTCQTQATKKTSWIVRNHGPPMTTPCFQGRLHDYTPITMVPRTWCTKEMDPGHLGFLYLYSSFMSFCIPRFLYSVHALAKRLLIFAHSSSTNDESKSLYSVLRVNNSRSQMMHPVLSCQLFDHPWAGTIRSEVELIRSK